MNPSVLAPKKYEKLYAAVGQLAQDNGIEAIDLFIADNKDPIVYARGTYQDKYDVIISSKLISMLTPDELTAVIADNIALENAREAKGIPSLAEGVASAAAAGAIIAGPIIAADAFNKRKVSRRTFTKTVGMVGAAAAAELAGLGGEAKIVSMATDTTLEKRPLIMQEDDLKSAEAKISRWYARNQQGEAQTR